MPSNMRLFLELHMQEKCTKQIQSALQNILKFEFHTTQTKACMTKYTSEGTSIVRSSSKILKLLDESKFLPDYNFLFKKGSIMLRTTGMLSRKC